MRRHPYRAVVVTWHDAVWHEDGVTEARHKPMTQVAIGWLLKSDKRGVSIAFEYNADDDGWRGEQYIPRPLVVRVEKI